MGKARKVAGNYAHERDGDETPPEEPPTAFPDPHEEEADFDRDEGPGHDTPPAEDGTGGTPNQAMEVDQEEKVPDNASSTLSSSTSTSTKTEDVKMEERHAAEDDQSSTSSKRRKKRDPHEDFYKEMGSVKLLTKQLEKEKHLSYRILLRTRMHFFHTCVRIHNMCEWSSMEQNRIRYFMRLLTKP